MEETSATPTAVAAATTTEKENTQIKPTELDESLEVTPGEQQPRTFSSTPPGLDSSQILAIVAESGGSARDVFNLIRSLRKQGAHCLHVVIKNKQLRMIHDYQSVNISTLWRRSVVNKGSGSVGSSSSHQTVSDASKK